MRHNAPERMGTGKMLDAAKMHVLLAARQPGHSLPQAFYVDPDIFEFDLMPSSAGPLKAITGGIDIPMSPDLM